MKSFKKLLVALVLMTVSVTVIGCGKKPASDKGPIIHETVSTTIGKDGGQLKDEDNLNISVPAGALNEDVNISATYVEDATLLSNDISMGFLGAVEFGPSGTTFNKPIQVSIKLTNTPIYNELTVFYYDEVDQYWNYSSKAVVNNNVATFEVSHFSKYEILNLTESMYLKFYDLVFEAYLDNKSDSWVSNSYRDYLINEEHVMDMYTRYGNYWYEPCGLFVYGDYLINGKSADQEALHIEVGESNKVGNKYGVSTVGGLHASKNEFEKAKKNATETTQIVDVTVVLEYKMITPVISLTAEKSQLKKGESTTVNVFCHYPNPNNYFEQYKDLPLGDYDLDLKVESRHVKIDQNHIVTGEGGKASFKATSKDGKSDTITATFDVSGDFGTHAEGKVSIIDAEADSFNFSGHITEQYSWEVEMGSTDVGTGASGVTIIINEHTILRTVVTIDYDFHGKLTIDDTDLEGTVSVSSVNAQLSSSMAVHDVTRIYNNTGHSENERYEFEWFRSASVQTTPMKDVHFSGVYSEFLGGIMIMGFDDDTDRTSFVEFTGNGHWRELRTNDDVDETASFVSKYRFSFSGPFSSTGLIKEGTFTKTTEDAKDGGHWWEDSPKTHNWPSHEQNYKESMTQTITFSK